MKATIKKVTIKIVNAFIDGTTGGNPAGIVTDADNLTHDQKLAIAKEVGLSETAFISTSLTASIKLDFYTPTRQIAHCGHATIAVFSYLAQTGKITQGWSSKETIDGNRKIFIKGHMAYMEQLAPKYEDVSEYHNEILHSLGLKDQHIMGMPKLVNTGNSFIVLGVKNAEYLTQLTPDFKAIESVSENLDLIGYYIFTQEASMLERDAAARMLAPRYGINEEAATGMAAGPLACYLYDEMAIKKNRFYIEQGAMMQPASPSIIDVNLDLTEGKICSLMAGGSATLTEDRVINIG